MSAAQAAPAAPAAASGTTDAVPVLRGKRKTLIIIAVALAVLLAVGGGAAAWFLKQRAAAAAAAEGEDGPVAEVAEAKPVKAELKNAPTFVPLDPFTVNLADREAERYAQVGVTLELADPKSADLLKAYLPAIRNNILLTLGSMTAAQLIERDGTLRRAAEIRREALRPLGYEIRLPANGVASGGRNAPSAGDDDDEAPIRAVHFSNFIIQ